MKIIKIIISVLFISLFSYTFSSADDCSKYDKLSKDYAKCTSDKLKKETSQKAEEIKSKTAKKIEEGKKKLKNFNLKDKLKNLKIVKHIKSLLKNKMDFENKIKELKLIFQKQNHLLVLMLQQKLLAIYYIFRDRFRFQKMVN